MAERQYRSPVIPDMGEFFGIEPSDIFNDRDSAEGYIAGQILAQKTHDEIITAHGHRTAEFREALLKGLHESL